MTTQFFSQIASLNTKGNIILTINTDDKDKLVVTVLHTDNAISNDVTQSIIPRIIKESPTVLDDGFFESITPSLEITKEIYDNFAEQKKTLEAARANSKAVKTTTEPKKEVEKKNTKYEAAMKLVDELEAKGQCRMAIGQLPKAAEFPDKAEEIQNKENALREKAGMLF